MATLKERCETELLNHQRACIPNLKENYHTELYNTITNLNEHNNTPLSIVKIQGAALRVMREDEEEVITYATNITVDTFSLASSPQREILNAIFLGEKL